MSAIFTFIQEVFADPFGLILGGLYSLTHSYVFAIFLLTLLVKLCLLPFSVKQYSNAKRRNELKPEVQKIREKYKGNKNKIEEEVQQLYKKEKVGSGNAGCTTSIIQMIVFIGLYGVISRPLSSILGFSEKTITAISNLITNNPNTAEINLLHSIGDYTDALLQNNVLTTKNLQEIIKLKEKFNFMGIDLTLTPQLTELNILWVIPISVLIISIFSSLYSHVLRRKKHPNIKGKFTALEAVPFITPLITFLFAFLLPAGIGFYWAISSLLSLIQKITLTKIFKADR